MTDDNSDNGYLGIRTFLRRSAPGEPATHGSTKTARERATHDIEKIADPELYELEQLYARTAPAGSEQTPDHIVENIRQLALTQEEKNLQSHKILRLIPRKALTFPTVSGLSIAAGLLIGILLPFDGDLGLNESLPVQSTQPVFMGQEQLEGELNLIISDPRAWQKLILESVIAGEMEKAQSLISEFNQRFPDFGSATSQD